MYSIYDEIKAGSYANKLPYPHSSEVGYLQQRTLYRQETNKLNEKFYRDLCEYSGEPVCEASRIIFDRAWEDAHSEGYAQIAQKWEDLLDFVEKVIDAKGI